MIFLVVGILFVNGSSGRVEAVSLDRRQVLPSGTARPTGDQDSLIYTAHRQPSLSLGSSVLVLKIKTTTKTAFFEMERETPVLYGLKDPNVQNWLNSRIRAPLIAFTDNLRKQAERDYRQWPQDQEFRTYIAHVSYDVTLNNDRLLSMVATMYQYTGGAHGLSFLEPFNFDLHTGKALRLADLFAPGVDYQGLIRAEINRQMAQNPERFFEPRLPENWVPGEHRFYLTEDAVVVFFDLYEIAPYASGIPQFAIPYSLLGDLLP